MQYDTHSTKPKTTKLGMRSDWPTSLSSAQYGANLNALGFNLDFITARRPHLAVELLRLYREASTLTEDTPPAPDEDLLSANAELHMRVFEQNR